MLACISFDFKKILDQVRYRVEWAKHQDKEKKKEEEALEKERGETFCPYIFNQYKLILKICSNAIMIMEYKV